MIDIATIGFTEKPLKNFLSLLKDANVTWEEYKERYLNLLKDRKIEDNIDQLFPKSGTVCFLCSEHQHQHCHRSLLADYVKDVKGNINIIHL